MLGNPQVRDGGLREDGAELESLGRAGEGSRSHGWSGEGKRVAETRFLIFEGHPSSDFGDRLIAGPSPWGLRGASAARPCNPNPDLEARGGAAAGYADHAGLIFLGKDEDGILADKARHHRPPLRGEGPPIEFHHPGGLAVALVHHQACLKPAHRDEDRILRDLLKAGGDGNIPGTFEGRCRLGLRLARGSAAGKKEDEKGDENPSDNPIASVHVHADCFPVAEAPLGTDTLVHLLPRLRLGGRFPFTICALGASWQGKRLQRFAQITSGC